MPLSPGSLLLQRYQILRSLKQGGMGEIYLARDVNLNTRVAIKESFATDAMANVAFQQEAQILATLAHPNLPRVTNFFIEPNGARYLVMDFVEGENLQDIVTARGRLTPNQMLTWFKTIFNAVNYLHIQPQPIIHRDINPRNIIIRPDGKAMLVDFGIAKVLTGTRTTHGLTGYGTPGYAPPEQYSGGTDQRTDVYALGATMYFALTGETPPDTPMRAAGAVLTPPSQFNPQVTPHIERAILIAMNLNAAQRFNSVADLAQSIYAAITQPLTKTVTAPPIAAQAPATVPLPARRAEFMPIIIGSLVGGILLATLILGGLYLGGFFGGGTVTPTRVSNITHTPTATGTLGAQPTIARGTISPPNPTTPIVPPITSPSVTATASVTSTFTPSDTATFVPTELPTPTFVPTDTPTATNIPFTLLGVQTTVSPERSSQCPVTFVFQATLRANVAGSTRYRWEFSDGRVSNDEQIDFNNAGSVQISAGWDFGGEQEIHYSGWAQVRVLEPVEMFSNRAQFQLDCSLPPTDTPTPTPPGLRGGSILFSSDRTGSNQIYSMDRNGDNARQITTTGGPNEDGAAAPDRQRIGFTHLYSINNGDIFGMNITGGAPNQLTQGSINWGAAWSPDGSRIVFYSLRDGGKQIYVMNADGSNQHRISSPDCAGDTDDWSPAWSRNGALIAYESIPHKKCEGGGTADIFISDPNGGGKRNVTRSAGIDDESPNWSPDGRIVFTSTRNGNYDIFVINTDGSGLQQLTSGPEDDDYPAWSPDGSTILFQRRQNGNWEIYAMNADGSNLRNLTNNPANDTFGEWVQ